MERSIETYGPAPLDDPSVYPGRWPDGPVLLSGGRVLTVPATTSTAGRSPILAIGSNACPAQLHRKGIGDDVLLMPVVLQNHLVVYAGHVTAYGSVPATVARWAGARTSIFAAWMTDAQLDRLGRTEGGNYRRVMLPTDDGLLPAFRATTGALRTADRHVVPLSMIACTGHCVPRAMTQSEALVLAL